MPDRRRLALDLLAANPSGCNELLLEAHGYTPRLIAELIEAGLAIRSHELTVTLIKITEAGLRVLKEDQ